jgi:hypothetical protein
MLIETTSGGAMIPLVLEPLLKATTSNPPSWAGNHYRLRHQGIRKGDFCGVGSLQDVQML